MQGDGLPRAALYRRISQTDDEFDKVENQLALLRQFCAGKYEIVADYCDDGISAWREDVVRPQWQRLLLDVAAGKFDVIVATFENRLTRQMAEKVQLVGVCKTSGAFWHTLHEGRVDPSSDDEVLLAYIKGWQGQSEISNRTKAQRQRFDAEHAAGNPLWGVRPFGFVDDKEGRKAKQPFRTPHPTESPEVRWAYAQILEGKTLYSIMKDWNDRGVTTTRGNRWSYATLQQLLRRESNVGSYNGTPMNWEPLVSRDTFDAVRALLKRPERAATRVREPRWLMAGIARCGTCGAALRSAKGSDRRASWPVYRCSSTMSSGGGKQEEGSAPRLRHSSIKCAELDVCVRSAVASAFLFAPTSMLPGTAEDTAGLHRAQEELSAVRAALGEVAEAVGDPDFPVAVLKKKAAGLRERETQLVGEVESIVTRSAQSAMLMASSENLLRPGRRISIDALAEQKGRLEHRFDALPLEHRRTLVRALLRVTVHPGRRPERVELRHLVATSLNNAGDDFTLQEQNQIEQQSFRPG
jgi:site-specific DNA recombinase